MIHESIGWRRRRGFTAGVLLAASAWLAGMGGCQGRRTETTAGGGGGGGAVMQRDATAAQTIYVPADGRVVIAEHTLGLAGMDNVEVQADGRRVRGVQRQWISLAASDPSPRTGEIRWVQASPWKVQPERANARRAGGGESGVWVLAFEVPAGARELTIGRGSGRRAVISRELFPLPEVDIEALDASAADFARAMLAPLERDPVQRWRLELAYARLGLGQPPEMLDPILAGWAMQESQRVWSALRNLHEADAALARQVIEAMTLCVRVPDDLGGGIVSAWPLDPRADERLFAALLRPDVTSRTRAAEAWLERVPRATAVATDVGGLRSGTSGAPLATVRVANLAAAPRLVSASIDDVGAGELPVPEPVTVGPRSMEAIYFEGLSRPISLRADTMIPFAKLYSSDWSAALMMPFTLNARPPGVAIGPLLPDLTQATWLEPESNWFVDVIKNQSEYETSGLLFLNRDSGREQWMLHLECAVPASTSTAGDALRVWLGPVRQPIAVIQLPRVGAAKVEVGGRDTSDAAAASRVVTLGDRWVAQLPLPPSAIERDGTIRIGVERLDARGVRTAWPCRMFPWQVEPGRFAISTSDWLALPPSPLDEP